MTYCNVDYRLTTKQSRKIMLNMTEKQKEILSDVIPNLKELMEADNLGNLHLSIDDIIVENKISSIITINQIMKG